MRLQTDNGRGASRPALESIRALINIALDRCLEAVRLDFATKSTEWIVDEVLRVVRSGGTRIRPLLCCCGYAAAGGHGGPTDEKVIRAAASLELLHTFAIVHDDVMDGSDIRRGQLTTHRRAADQRQADGIDGDAMLYGTSVAILAGDLALVLSDVLLAESGFHPNLIVEASAPLGRMRLDAVAGQYLDLKHSGQASPDQDVAARIAQLKTGSYSIAGPLLFGATLAGGRDDAKKALEEFGVPLGQAFQLADDLMGLLGDPQSTGKDVENDLRRGRPTSLIARALRLASPPDRETIRRIWGNPNCTEEDISALRLAVRRSGAVESTAGSIRMLVVEAKNALAEPTDKHLQPDASRLLEELADSISARASGRWSTS